MRRHVGLSSLSPHQTASADAYSSLSSSLSAAQLGTLQAQLSTFQAALHSFANKHRARILSDPAFRTQFSEMCRELGVDPLGSGGRRGGLWDSFLGVGDWTYALAVQVVDVCLASRERNGGLIEIDEVVRGVSRLRSGPANSKGKSITSSAQDDKDAAVTAQDVIRAIDALKPLGCGYTVITAGNKQMIRCVAAELDTDSLTLLQAASEAGQGYVTVSALRRWTATSSSIRGPVQGWTEQRALHAIEKALMAEGMVWVDDQASGELQYWLPSLFDFTEATPSDRALAAG